MLLTLFRPEGEPRVSIDALRRQREALGPVTAAERATLAALAVLVAGLVAQPFLGIEPAWVAAISLAIVSAGVLGREQLRASIDWGFPLFFGVILGSASVLQGAGVDRWLGAALPPLASAIDSPPLVLMLVAVLTMLTRVALPSRPAVILLALGFVPEAHALHIAHMGHGLRRSDGGERVGGAIPGLEYVVLRESTKSEKFDDLQGAQFGAALELVRLLAIAASIPFWSAVGLVGP